MVETDQENLAAGPWFPKNQGCPGRGGHKKSVVSIQQEGAAPLGHKVIAGHVGAPVAQYLGHVAQADGGQLEGPLEAAAEIDGVIGSIVQPGLCHGINQTWRRMGPNDTDLR